MIRTLSIVRKTNRSSSISIKCGLSQGSSCRGVWTLVPAFMPYYLWHVICCMFHYERPGLRSVLLLEFLEYHISRYKSTMSPGLSLVTAWCSVAHPEKLNCKAKSRTTTDIWGAAERLGIFSQLFLSFDHAANTKMMCCLRKLKFLSYNNHSLWQTAYTAVTGICGIPKYIKIAFICC